MIIKLFVILVGALLVSSQQSALVSGIPDVLARGATVELVQEGFVFTEGPVRAPDGGLYFSDLLTADKIFHMSPGGSITVFREKTNGMNGLAVDKSGSIVGVESTGKRVSRIANGQLTVLTEGTAEKPLLAPNDVFLDAKGGVYFTDPGPRPVVPGRTVYVYYLPPNSKAPMLLDDKVIRPNGIILTTNGQTLLVNDSNSDTIYRYDVQTDGSVKNKRAFATLRDVPQDKISGADGMAIDRQDRLYVATATGVQIFSNSGSYLGTIPVPRQPSNVAFAGPERKTLFITAREGLYRLQTLAQGPDRPGK
jgi:gluconolactonase